VSWSVCLLTAAAQWPAVDQAHIADDFQKSGMGARTYVERYYDEQGRRLTLAMLLEWVEARRAQLEQGAEQASCPDNTTTDAAAPGNAPVAKMLEQAATRLCRPPADVLPFVERLEDEECCATAGALREAELGDLLEHKLPRQLAVELRAVAFGWPAQDCGNWEELASFVRVSGATLGYTAEGIRPIVVRLEKNWYSSVAGLESWDPESWSWISLPPRLERALRFRLAHRSEAGVPAGCPEAPRGPGNRTRLMEAAVVGSTECLTAMIVAGDPLDALDRNRETALMLAALAKQVDAVALVLEAGADPDRRGADGMSALSLAAQDGRLELVQALARGGASPDVLNQQGQTALVSAIQEGHEQVAVALVQAGANTDARGARGYTPLMIAVTSGYRDLVLALVDHGADLSAVGAAGYTALHLAALGSHEEMLRILVESGADITTAGPGGDTILMAAAQLNLVESVKLLLGKGMSTAAKDGRGWTALMLAKHGSTCERLLLDAADMPQLKESSVVLKRALGEARGLAGVHSGLLEEAQSRQRLLDEAIAQRV